MMRDAGNTENKKSKGKAQWKVAKGSFVNPYNFVSLGCRCCRKKLEECIPYKSLKTGWLECTLYTKTPIFIPNTTNENAFNVQGKAFDFFSYEDISHQNRNDKYAKPVIPGSSLRGVIRSAYEAVTDSCMSTIDDGGILHKRTTTPKKPGILRYNKDGWYIQEAERVRISLNTIANMNQYREGQEVYILANNKNSDKNQYLPEVIKISSEDFPGSKKGYFHKTAPFTKKRYESVFIPKDDRTFQIDEDAVERLKEVVRLYKENEDYGTYYENYEVKDGCLIYYSDNGTYLSPACITREVFKNRLKDILKQQGGYQPCVSRKAVCECCILFGMVGDKQAIGSRIRFTDALPSPQDDYKDYYAPLVILRELASPKTSATEFYLKRPKNSDLWNYDYAIRYDEKGNPQKIPDYKPEIRGRKFYWHSGKQPHTNELNERNCMVRPVNKGKEFHFRVYFDGITEEELKKLIWILNLGSNENQYCHKIGKAKPLGFGSVKIKVNKAFFREIYLDSDSIKYEVICKDINELPTWEISEDQKSIKEFLKLMDYQNKPSNVCYPLAKDNTIKSINSEASHQWFAGNKVIRVDEKGKELKNRSFSKPGIYKELPEADAEDVSLPRYEKIYENR